MTIADVEYYAYMYFNGRITSQKVNREKSFVLDWKSGTDGRTEGKALLLHSSYILYLHIHTHFLYVKALLIVFTRYSLYRKYFDRF